MVPHTRHGGQGAFLVADRSRPPAALQRAIRGPGRIAKPTAAHGRIGAGPAKLAQTLPKEISHDPCPSPPLERPLDGPTAFTLDLIEALIEDNDDWANTEPFRKILSLEQQELAATVSSLPLEAHAVACAGMTGSEYTAVVESWLVYWSSDLPGPDRRAKAPSGGELDLPPDTYSTEFPGGLHDSFSFHSPA